MMQASNRDACPWLKHKRTCKKQMPPGSFLARRLDPTPRTTNPISDPDISQSLPPNVSESQSVILSSHDLWGNNPRRLPEPSRTNPLLGPQIQRLSRLWIGPTLLPEFIPAMIKQTGLRISCMVLHQ